MLSGEIALKNNHHCYYYFPHKCRCGATVDKYGQHPLSCQLCALRLLGHTAFNYIIKPALSSAGLNVVLEPVGLDRGNG